MIVCVGGDTAVWNVCQRWLPRSPSGPLTIAPRNYAESWAGVHAFVASRSCFEVEEIRRIFIETYNGERVCLGPFPVPPFVGIPAAARVPEDSSTIP